MAEDKPADPKQVWGDKKLPVHRVPPAALLYTAMGIGEGADKYGPFNWRETPGGVEVLTYYAGCVRHLQAWFDGEDIDPDSAEGKPHLAGAISSLAILIDAIASGCAIDNRPPKGGAPKLLESGARITKLTPEADDCCIAQQMRKHLWCSLTDPSTEEL